jgi:RNA polymerase sigma-70 factor (ECF subfamily)
MGEGFPDDGARTLEERIARLPEAQRSILRLALEENRSYEELARICGTSVPAVKSRLHRARENLRALMLADDPK